MGRSPCCEKVGLKKGPWTTEEDQKLVAYIEEHGHGSWRALPTKAGLQRCGKSCRLRWTNYLRPDIKRGKFSLQEEQTIIQLHALLGNRWSAIATHLPKRTDNEIKNYWNTHLKKRLTKMGIDPVTHKPKSDALGSGHSKDSANLSHMAQWESARLEAEARLVRESKLVQPRSNPGPVAMQNQLRPPSTLAHRATALPPLLPCLDVLKAWQGAWSKPTKEFTLSPSMCYNFAGDDLESPTSTLSFVDQTVPIQTMGFVTPNNIGSSMMSELKQRLLMENQAIGLQGLTSSYPVAEVAWEDNHRRIVPMTDMVDHGRPDMFGFDGLEQGSSMLTAGHGHGHSIDINNINDDDNNGNCGDGEFEDNKNYWDSILNMVSASPSGSPVF